MPQLLDIVGNAEEFPILNDWHYFNHAGVSPWPMRTIRAVRAFAESFGVDCFQSHNPDETVAELRALLARLLNAEFDEIAIVRNTGDGLSQIALGLHWNAGDVIVVPQCEYPSNLYPWMEACRRFGCKLVEVPERIGPDGVARVHETELIDTARAHRAKLLAVSHVQWASGQHMDLNRLGAFCRDAGVLFCVDAIQSLGVVPVDVNQSHIDFLVSGGHKWLMSPPGAGVLFCRRQLLERIHPPAVGWLSVVNPYRWETNYTLRTEAGRFETGTHAYACLVGMKHSVEFLLQLGIQNIHQHVQSLGEQFINHLQGNGFIIATPRKPLTAGAVCLTHPNLDPEKTVRRLRKEHRIELAARAGRLRFAPHCYNTESQTARAAEILVKLSQD
jgi:cysteine desulfurase / selenocysteine lyase